ncbi:MAG: hypothetical protein K5663_11365 [Clostridiales bacterium]|nr:hypothetical protein [Clostridiales bacterium]
MKIEEVTWGGLIAAVAIILLLIGIYNTVMTALKNHREEAKRKRAPVEKLEGRADATSEMLKQHEQMLQSDKERLNAMEEQQRIMLRAMVAMLSHEINGNSTDKLQASMVEIQNYLISK